MRAFKACDVERRPQRRAFKACEGRDARGAGVVDLARGNGHLPTADVTNLVRGRDACDAGVGDLEMGRDARGAGVVDLERGDKRPEGAPEYSPW